MTLVEAPSALTEPLRVAVVPVTAVAAVVVAVGAFATTREPVPVAGPSSEVEHELLLHRSAVIVNELVPTGVVELFVVT